MLFCFVFFKRVERRSLEIRCAWWAGDDVDFSRQQIVFRVCEKRSLFHVNLAPSPWREAVTFEKNAVLLLLYYNYYHLIIIIINWFCYLRLSKCWCDDNEWVSVQFFFGKKLSCMAFVAPVCCHLSLFAVCCPVLEGPPRPDSSRRGLAVGRVQASWTLRVADCKKIHGNITCK